MYVGSLEFTVFGLWVSDLKAHARHMDMGNTSLLADQGPSLSAQKISPQFQCGSL